MPEGEVWGLRRGNLHGPSTNVCRAPARQSPLWRSRESMLDWLCWMAAPHCHTLFHLAPLGLQRFSRFLAFWAPRDGDWVGAIRLLTARMVEGGWLPREEALAPLLQVPGRLDPTPEERGVFPVVETPAEDFAALPLFRVACSAGDYVILKWRAARLTSIEVLEVKTGHNQLSRKQRECVKYLRMVARRVQALLGHGVGVEYKLVSVEPIPRHRPREALVTARPLLRIPGV